VLFAQQCDDINIMAVLAFFKTSLVIDDRLAPSDISA